ncbi:DUF1405 domain-containing protein [Paenibacillus sp. MBLB4367]|uniref:DUF1405 domain-containing protein n=1 Tax=Paenibacillus sp. MBLB4367 TaxID=3384767 RepID=UPI0039080AC1
MPTSLSHFWSRPFLTSRSVLWTLFLVNLGGTYYGYVWYWEQLKLTVETKPLWMVILVPDSPTGSLFFTLGLLYLLIDSYRSPVIGKSSALRSMIETVGVVSSFKYGIWAVVVIVAANAQGSPGAWQDWMLSISHLGMAAEALLFARFFNIRPIGLAAAALWVFASDFVDYTYDVFPALPKVLLDDLPVIQLFTILLSAISLLVFYMLSAKRT